MSDYATRFHPWPADQPLQVWLESLARAFGPGWAVHESKSGVLLSPGEAHLCRESLLWVDRADTWVSELFEQQRLAEPMGLVSVPEAEEFANAAGDVDDVGLYFHAGVARLLQPKPHLISIGADPTWSLWAFARESFHLRARGMELPCWLECALAFATEALLGRPAIPEVWQFESHQGAWTPDEVARFFDGSAWQSEGEERNGAVNLCQIIATRLGAECTNAQVKQLLHTASRADAGRGALVETLGFGPGDLLRDVLGPGDWSPS